MPFGRVLLAMQPEDESARNSALLESKPARAQQVGIQSTVTCVVIQLRVDNMMWRETKRNVCRHLPLMRHEAVAHSAATESCLKTPAVHLMQSMLSLHNTLSCNKPAALLSWCGVSLNCVCHHPPESITQYSTFFLNCLLISIISAVSASTMLMP